MIMELTTGREGAIQLDLEDSLAKFRERFFIPEGTIYLDGNSLGLLSKEAEKSLLRVVDEWKKLGIRGWFETKNPWFYFGESLGEMVAPLVGADPKEVVATGTTTINLHSLVSSFYHPHGKRTKILADELDFPTDIYALKSQIRLKGLDPNKHLVLVPSDDGRTLSEAMIVDHMTDEIALILLPSALYRSGQLLDIKSITKEAHSRDIPIGWDCCHSVGAVPHHFDDWGIDFAFWCSYKYLNSGPGGTAFLYINRKHFNTIPGLSGWFGYVKDKQFDMSLEFEHAKSAGGWQISSSNILCSAPLEGSLQVTLEAGIDNIRAKSIKITTYLINLVDNLLTKDPYNFKIGTPRNPDQRTGHVALEHDREAFRISEVLKTKGVITDFRPPNVIRIAPCALYNRFQEIWDVVHILREIIENKEYESIQLKNKLYSEV
ncbi:MAG: kynureninase [Candidatus Hodarchaeales archaeon]|jgi:kynureninase